MWERPAFWNRFTARAQFVMIAAEEETGRQGRREVGPVDLLLALLRQGPEAPGMAGLAAVGLERLLAKLEEQGKAATGQPKWEPGEGELAAEQPEWAPGMRERLVQGFATEAEQLGHNYISTEHMLLTVLSLESAVIQEALAALGTDAAALRESIIRWVTRKRPFPPRQS